MMDATLTGLLFDCVEANDGTPHLILADWLEDHGQPERAELVRVQCRLADWVPDWRARRDLIARQDELIAAHRDEWLGPLAKHCQQVRFERGLAYVSVTGKRFAGKTFGPAFAAAAATALIAQVRILKPAVMEKVATVSSLEAIPALSFAGLALGADLDPLLASPHLNRLVALDLTGNALPDRAVNQLISAPLASSLARIELRNNDLTPPALDDLTLLPRLRELDLAGNHCNDPEHLALRQRLGIGTRVMNTRGMEFVRIPAGTYLRGSPESDEVARANEKPQHEVELTQPFWLGRFAVTQGQYLAVMGENPSRFPALFRPVEQVTWEQAVAFCERLGQRDGRTYRLPTEAEWEHACRAGTFTPFHMGPPPSSDLVNYDGRAQYCYGGAKPSVYLRRTAEVGRYPPNAFGLYEMHGNVWEWCADWYGEKTYKKRRVVDPTGPKRGSGRVRRGGCWDAIGSYCRAAHRNGQSPTEMNHYTGFRVVLSGSGGAVSAGSLSTS